MICCVMPYSPQKNWLAVNKGVYTRQARWCVPPALCSLCYRRAIIACRSGRGLLLNILPASFFVVLCSCGGSGLSIFCTHKSIIECSAAIS